MSEPMFERIALIGIGLIGSSISHASRRAGLAKSIVGSARTPATVETAMRLGLIEQGFVSPSEAVEGADLVILCTPVGLVRADRQGDFAQPEAGRDPNGRRLGQGFDRARRGAARSARACISWRVIRSRAPSSRAPKQASLSCSMAAGASLRLRPIRTARRSRSCGPSGRRWGQGRGDDAGAPRLWCSRSPATCRI